MQKVEQTIEKSIYLIRDQKVMLDEDLARLYQVRTKALVQAVKRNSNRFPEDFMFQLTAEEYSGLRSQIVTSSGKHGRRALPYAFVVFNRIRELIDTKPKLLVEPVKRKKIGFGND